MWDWLNKMIWWNVLTDPFDEDEEENQESEEEENE